MWLYTKYSVENLDDATPDLVIPGNAVPRGNPELEALLNLRWPYLSMTEAVRDFFLRDSQSIVVAGTHGKTTTSSMAAWLLQSAGLNPSFLVGGIPRNFGKSFQWKKGARYFVIEGDEYDTGFMDRRPKFVQYLPQYVILHSIEYDHADIYPDLAAVENAFWQFIKVVPGNGHIIVNRDNETAYELAKRGYSKLFSFGVHPESDYHIAIKRWSDGVAHFQLNDRPYCLRTFGKHNVSNACAVAILGELLEISEKQIQEAFSAFEGVKRRMELRGEVNGIAVYDDFAHHPTAIRSTLEGARLAFPEARIWGVFEPRSWSSRRNIFQKEFAGAFRFADIAVIARVYEPEKLEPEVRLNPEKLILDMRQGGTESYYIPDMEELIGFVRNQARPGDKVILMSNGSFDHFHDRLLQRLNM